MTEDMYFRIKHRGINYIVMTRKQQSDAMLGDPMEAAKWMESLGKGIMIANDRLYATLLKMTFEYQREEMTIG